MLSWSCRWALHSLLSECDQWPVVWVWWPVCHRSPWDCGAERRGLRVVLSVSIWRPRNTKSMLILFTWLIPTVYIYIFLVPSCRKSSEESVRERQKVVALANMKEPSLLQFYISREWLNKFNTFAEPGPISNHTFLCQHGGVCLKHLRGHIPVLSHWENIYRLP